MNQFQPQCLATAVGSMPQTNPEEACSLVLQYLPQIPAWPQLPRRSFLENMYVQFSQGFPGVVVEEERIWVDRSQDLSPALEELYKAYVYYEKYLRFNHDADYQVDYGDYAKGFNAFLAALHPRPHNLQAVKGQVTGPVSMGLAVTDQDRRPLLYDPVLADALARHLRLKAAWQERRLKLFCPNTIIFVDEPYLSFLGSAFVSIPQQQVVSLLEEVLGGIGGLKGVHCCGNTDWSLLLGTSIDILNFDAYNYGESLSLYPVEVNRFLERGGIIAWGIVPSYEQALAVETVDGLRQRLEQTVGSLCSKGVDYDMLWKQCLLTPSCGLGSLSPEGANRALALLAALSQTLRTERR